MSGAGRNKGPDQDAPDEVAGAPIDLRTDRCRFTSRAVIEGELRMVEVGEWCREKGTERVNCQRRRGISTAPSVYLIVAVDTDGAAAEVLYAGKGIDGWERRRGKHQGNRDRAFHHLIRDALETPGRRVLVFARNAAWLRSGDVRVSLYEAEESVLIARFRPSANDPKDVARKVALQTAPISDSPVIDLN